VNLSAWVDARAKSSKAKLAGRLRIAAMPPMPDPRTLGLLDWTRLVLPKYAALAFNDLHRQIAADADKARGERGGRFAYAGPRDTGKSVLLSLAGVLRDAVEGVEEYTLIASETADLAEKLLYPIREELETNEILAALYPHATGVGPVWQQDKLRLRNGVVVECLGTGKSLRGSRNRDKRPTKIVCDDAQGDKHLWSPRLRERTETWFNGELMKAGDPRCNVFVAGNAIHRDCVVCKLEKRPNWQGHTFRSIVNWPDRMDLWGEWESILTNGSDIEREAKALAFYEANREAMHQGAEVLWPDRVGLYTLMVERASEGHIAFERERQANPISVDSVEWPDSVFEGDDLWFDEWPQTVCRVVAIDPSTGKDAKRGDYSAIVTVGYGEDGLVYIDADLARRPVDKIAADAIQQQQTVLANLIGTEDVAFQQWVGAEIDRQARAMKLLIPVVGIKPDASKGTRIRRCGPYLSQRRFRFKRHSKGTRMLFDQLREFPGGEHDDGPDALEMGLRLVIAQIGDNAG